MAEQVAVQLTEIEILMLEALTQSFTAQFDSVVRTGQWQLEVVLGQIVQQAFVKKIETLQSLLDFASYQPGGLDEQLGSRFRRMLDVLLECRARTDQLRDDAKERIAVHQAESG